MQLVHRALGVIPADGVVALKAARLHVLSGQRWLEANLGGKRLLRSNEEHHFHVLVDRAETEKRLLQGVNVLLLGHARAIPFFRTKDQRHRKGVTATAKLPDQRVQLVVVRVDPGLDFAGAWRTCININGTPRPRYMI